MSLLAVRLLSFAALFVMIDAVQIVGFSMRAYKNNLPIYRFDGGVLVDCPPSWLLLRHHEFRQRVGRCMGFWVGIIVGVGVASGMIAIKLIGLLRQPLPKDFVAEA